MAQKLWQNFLGLDDLFSLLCSSSLCEEEWVCYANKLVHSCCVLFLQYSDSKNSARPQYNPPQDLLLHDINKIALMICQEIMHILPSSRFQSLSQCVRIPTGILPCISHRSLTRQHHGRCSRCLTRLTKSCTKEEAAEEGSSRGCRMNVSSGPLISCIFGTSSAFSCEYPPLWVNYRVVVWSESNAYKFRKHYTPVKCFM